MTTYHPQIVLEKALKLACEEMGKDFCPISKCSAPCEGERRKDWDAQPQKGCGQCWYEFYIEKAKEALKEKKQ